MLTEIVNAFQEGRRTSQELYQTIEWKFPQKAYSRNLKRRRKLASQSFLDYVAYGLGAVSEMDVGHFFGFGKYRNLSFNLPEYPYPKDPLDMTSEQMKHHQESIISNFRRYGIPREVAVESAVCFKKSVMETRAYLKANPIFGQTTLRDRLDFC